MKSSCLHSSTGCLPRELRTILCRLKSKSKSKSHCDWRSVNQWVLVSSPDIYYFLTVAVLICGGALSDERKGLSFVYAAGPRQRSLSRVRVPWLSRPYITVSVLRLPFSSPPTTGRVTVEVFDPASTRVTLSTISRVALHSLHTDPTENSLSTVEVRLPSDCIETVEARTYRNKSCDS
jgi:hypothetical protein